MALLQVFENTSGELRAASIEFVNMHRTNAPQGATLAEAIKATTTRVPDAFKWFEEQDTGLRVRPGFRRDNSFKGIASDDLLDIAEDLNTQT